MMVNFDFLSEPITFSEDKIQVVCIENKRLFRNIYTAFISGELEKNNIVFSNGYIPFESKGNICAIYDYFFLSYSSSIIKKLYEQIENYCNAELLKETLELKTYIVNYMESVVKAFDYDFDFNYEINLVDVFKIMNLTPAVDKAEVLNSLLDYMLIINKYATPKCFVLMNLHLYFTNDEIELFYRDVVDRRTCLLVIENICNFEKSNYENILIYDKDFCEIVEN